MKIDRMVIPKSFFVNAAAGALALFLVVWVVRDTFIQEEAPTCSTRFAQGTLFALETQTGRLLTPDELQARLQGTDQGLIENLEVVRIGQGGPATSALKVRLAAVGGSDTQSDAPRNYGIGFHWVPRRLPATAGVCLSYSVRLAKDFDYGTGGNLPGITGGRSGEEHISGAQSIGTRVRWLPDGRLELRPTVEGVPPLPAFGIDQDRIRLDRGRWVRIEQEVVLNRPGQKDGLIRVWIDDRLRLERVGLALREDPDVRFHGVAASVGFSVPAIRAGSVKEGGEIEISPFEVRWP